MKLSIAALLFAIGMFADAARAQSAPLVQAIASHFFLQSNSGSCDPTTCQVSYTLQCPSGYLAAAYWVAPKFPIDVNQELTRDLIDSNRRVINRASLSTAIPLIGGGYSVLFENVEHHPKEIEAMVTCLAAAASTDSILTIVKATATIGKASSGTVTAFCPSDYPVALGGFSNADGRVLLLDRGGAPVWGSSANPTFLADVPDGQTGPPGGWQIKVYNDDFFSSVDAVAFGICGKAPELQTFVYSVPVPQPAFGLKTPFSIFAPIPDGWTAVGSGFDGGTYGDYFESDVWMQDGTMLAMLQWYPASKNYDSGTAEVRAFITRGVGNAPSSGRARAAMAVLALPKPSSAPTSVSIVEYYHAQLDHYFITGIADEIAKLDNGTFAGWQRTGQTFKGYAIGSAGRTGRRPVCREYGNPLAGLNSHFYSASPDECVATLVNGGGYSWLLESSEVFQMDLPDPLTGACPVGGVPIHRVFNQRKDVNHRYTTSIAIRDQMVARGGVAEGYGPNAVVLCGLP